MGFLSAVICAVKYRDNYSSKTQNTHNLRTHNRTSTREYPTRLDEWRREQATTCAASTVGGPTQREFDRIHAMRGVRTWDYWFNETLVVAAPVPEPATQAVLSTETTVDQVPGQMIVFYLI